MHDLGRGSIEIDLAHSLLFIFPRQGRRPESRIESGCDRDHPFCVEKYCNKGEPKRDILLRKIMFATNYKILTF